MDPNGSGTDRVLAELYPVHSKPGRMQAFGVRPGLDKPDMNAIWIRLSQARSGSVLNLAPAHSNSGRMQTLGLRHGSIEPCLDPTCNRLSHARIW